MLKKKGGLGSLIPGSDLINESLVEVIPVDAIATNPYQPRINFDHSEIDELAESIKVYGIIQPLTVRKLDIGYELIAGERRLIAAHKAGLAEVPALIRDCSDEDMLAIALIENIQRADLNAIETALSYKKLQDEFGLTQHEIAEKVGKSRSAVANSIRLLELPDIIIEALAKGIISEGHGKALLAEADVNYQKELLQGIIAQKLTVRDIEAKIAAKKRGGNTSTKSQKIGLEVDPDLEHIRHKIQVALSTRVNFRFGSTDKHGHLEIEYFSTEDLENIYELLTKK